MSFLTKEESRVALLNALFPLVGVLLGGFITLLGTHITLAENRKVQIEASRRQAYTQLMGEKAEILMLGEQLADAHDKSTLYQGRAAQLMLPANQAKGGEQSRSAPQIKGVNDPQSYLADAMQQERNAEHYNDELVTCGQKVFESIALVQLSFPADQELDNRIAAVQAMLTRTRDVLPQESQMQRMLWVMTTTDAEQQLSVRAKQRMAYIERAVQPITDLLDYLKPKSATTLHKATCKIGCRRFATPESL